MVKIGSALTGLAERRGPRVVLARNLLSSLRDRELAEVGKVIQQQTGLIHRPLSNGEHANGVYRRSVQLASDRFAMLDDGMGFSLVPWRPVVEQRLGQASVYRRAWGLSDLAIGETAGHFHLRSRSLSSLRRFDANGYAVRS